jgi:alpha-glucuronidase
MNAPTPETDREWHNLRTDDAKAKRMYWHARQLERQRDEARQSAAYWRDVATGTFARSATLPWEETK